MAHSRPARVSNRGDAARKVVAHGRCVTLLAEDLRIIEAYRNWFHVQDRRLRDGPPAWVRTSAELDQVMLDMRNAEIDSVAEVLRGMGVPWRWCAEVLVTVLFETMRYNQLHPEKPDRALKVSTGIAGLPLGRLPRNQGNDIQRHVEWWYAHKIKNPPDTIPVLEKRERERLGQTWASSRHSTVIQGIQQAETLLNLVADST